MPIVTDDSPMIANSVCHYSDPFDMVPAMAVLVATTCPPLAIPAIAVGAGITYSRLKRKLAG